VFEDVDDPGEVSEEEESEEELEGFLTTDDDA
jgi:hypothetical protein